MSRAFTRVNTQLQWLKDSDSDMSDSKDEYKASHFQMDVINFGKNESQFAQLDKEFEPHIASIFNQTSGCNISIKTRIDLRGDILLEI